MSSSSPAQDLAEILEKLAAKKKAPGGASFSPPKMPELPKPLKPPALPAIGGAKPVVDINARRSNELELWKTWKDNGMKPAHLEPLMKSLEPLIQKSVGRYKNSVEIPNEALTFANRKLVVDALKTYDPNKGALSTHLTWALKKSDRFVKKHQNFARIPENVAGKIGKYQAAKAELSERLGHEPDDLAIAEHSGLSLKMVKTINRSMRKGLTETGGEDDIHQAHSAYDREMEVALLIHPHLTPEERLVHQYSVGLNGHPKLKPGEIAKKLGFDNSKVSKLRSSIIKKMKPYLEE